MAYVYLIRLHGEPKYVGFTTQTLADRWKQHHMDAKRGSPFILHQAIRKYGEKSFSIESLKEGEDAAHLMQVEEPRMIVEYKTFKDFGIGYNMTLGGEHHPTKLCEESKRKMSSAAKRRCSRDPEQMRQIALAGVAKRRASGTVDEHNRKISESVKATCRQRKRDEGLSTLVPADGP